MIFASDGRSAKFEDDMLDVAFEREGLPVFEARREARRDPRCAFMLHQMPEPA